MKSLFSKRPLVMTKLPLSSAKSVFCDVSPWAPNPRVFAFLSVAARLMPWIAPSRNLKPPLPLSVLTSCF